MFKRRPGEDRNPAWSAHSPRERVCAELHRNQSVVIRILLVSQCYAGTEVCTEAWKMLLKRPAEDRNPAWSAHSPRQKVRAASSIDASLSFIACSSSISVVLARTEVQRMLLGRRWRCWTFGERGTLTPQTLHTSFFVDTVWVWKCHFAGLNISGRRLRGGARIVKETCGLCTRAGGLCNHCSLTY